MADPVQIKDSVEGAVNTRFVVFGLGITAPTARYP